MHGTVSISPNPEYPYEVLLKSPYLLSLQVMEIKKNFLKDFIYLFLQRGEGKEKERKRNINVWLPLVHPLLGIWPATQACDLTGSRTGNPLVRSWHSVH